MYLIFHLLKELVPAIRSIADEVYIFQQDNALAHHAVHVTQWSCFVVNSLLLTCGHSTARILQRLITAFGE